MTSHPDEQDFDQGEQTTPEKGLDIDDDETKCQSGFHGIVGPNDKNPPKTWFKKFVKLMDHTYAFNSLTNFEYEANAMTGIKNYVNLLKLTRKNL